MKFLEQNLEDIIFNYKETCCEKGLYECYPSEHSKLFRQVNLGRYGVADLIAVDFTHHMMPVRNLDTRYTRTIRINIIECKLKEINIAAYLQAKRYKTAIKELLKRYNLKNTRVDFHVVLVGRSIEDSSDFVFQLNDDYKCSVYTYDYGPNGIEFEDHYGQDWRIPGGMPSQCQSDIPHHLKPVLRASFSEALKEFKEDMEGYREYSMQREIEEALNRNTKKE